MDSSKLKELLKSVKLHENNLSIVFGLIIIIIASVYFVRFINKEKQSLDVPTAAADVTTDQSIYKVEKGDDLWKIAVKLFDDGYKWIEIAKINNIKNPGMITVGQELKIPNIDKEAMSVANEVKVSETPPQTPTAKPTLTTTPIQDTLLEYEPISSENYEVVKGDNLWNICVRAYKDGYKWVEIAKINNIKNPNLILPGMSLTLPR